MPVMAECDAWRADRLKHRTGIPSWQIPPYTGTVCQRIEASMWLFLAWMETLWRRLMPPAMAIPLRAQPFLHVQPAQRLLPRRRTSLLALIHAPSPPPLS